MKTIGERLRAARKHAELSVEVVATRLGMHPSAVRHHENGQREPRLKEVARYSRMYRVSTDWLIEGIGAGPGDPTGDLLDAFRKIPEALHAQAIGVLKALGRK